MTRVSQRVTIGSRPPANGPYAAGLTGRDIRAYLEDPYGLRACPDLISRVTDAVPDEVREWQHRARVGIYPIVILGSGPIDLLGVGVAA